MKKYTLFLALLLFTTNAFAVADWDKTSPATSSNAADIGVNVATNNNEALDRLMGDYRRDCSCVASSTTSFNVLAGEIAIPNSDGSIVRWRKNTSVTPVTSAQIDAGGAFSNSTQYYVYAVADASATTFTVKLSTSSSAPSGATYFRGIGYLYIDSSGNITCVGNVRGGDVENAVQVINTTADTISDTSYGTQLTGTTVHFISSGRPIVLDFNATSTSANWMDNSFSVIADLDGSNQTNSERFNNGTATYSGSLDICGYVLYPSAGAHTITIHGKVTGSNDQINIKKTTVREL